MLKKKKAKKMVSFIGLSSMTKVADRLKALDFVLGLFKMKIGAESLEVDCSGGCFTCVRLTVYFTNKESK